MRSGAPLKRTVLCLCLTCACTRECPNDHELTTACLPTDVFEAIEQHAFDLTVTAGLLAGHARETETVGFFLAPALPTPPALPASFGTLAMPCAGPLEYEPFCEQGRCSQITCTGEGSEWVHRVWLEEPAEANGWSSEVVETHLRWNEDDAWDPRFGIETIATSPDGRDASMSAFGSMDRDALMWVVELFPALHRAGPTVLEYDHDTSIDSGRLTIDEVVVAEVSPSTGRLLPTGDCP